MKKAMFTRAAYNLYLFEKHLFRRHRINQRVQILAMTQKNPKIHMSNVTCRVSPVTCHMSQTPTATATDTLTANSHTMHSRTVLKDLKSTFFFPQDNFRPFLRQKLNNLRPCSWYYFYLRNFIENHHFDLGPL